MRVIAGELKGRGLKPPPGQASRPTTDRVREAWASSVTSLVPDGFQGAHVLDAFAGSGALGIEAVSRGAQAVLFVDSDPAALKAVKANLVSLGLSHRPGLRVVRADSLRPQGFSYLEALAPYSLICLDPPYALPQSELALALSAWIKAGLLADGCLVSYEHQALPQPGSAAAAADWPEGLEVVSCKQYGSTAIEYLSYIKPA